MGIYRASIIEHPLDETLESAERRILAALRPMYDTQRQTTLGAVEGALAAPQHTNWIALASELHTLAGTAAHFGETELGDIARTAENTIRLDEPRNQQLIALREVRQAIALAS